MRAYRIELTAKTGGSIAIGGNTQPLLQSSSQLILQQNIGNMGDNIHIEFEFLSYSKEGDKQVFDTAHITLYNVNRYWHNENAVNQLIDANIKVFAGSKATPLMYRQNMIDELNTCYARTDFEILRKPIYNGTVANAYPDMDGQDTVLILNLTPESTIEENTQLNQLNIPEGSLWRNEVQRFMQYLLHKEKSKDKVVIGIPSENSVMVNSTEINTTNINCILNKNDGESLEKFVKDTFNEDIHRDNQTGIYYIGKMIPIIKTVSDRNLLGQPQMTNASNIVFTVPMSNLYSIHDVVNLEMESFVSYQQKALADGDLTTSVLQLARGGKSEKMFAGAFEIIKLWHIGQSRNPNIDAWCTKIEAVKKDISAVN